MIELLARLLIPNRGDARDPKVRRAYGALCGAAGIALNLLLFAAKYAAGTASGSIAVTADAFNNLSDAGSSAVTALGFRLSGKRDDDEHPFGHGRAEYIAGLVVALIVVMMGLELARSALTRILSPAPVAFRPLTAAVLAGAALVKLAMFRYNRRVGGRICSVALRAAAMDSLSDAAATAAVLAGMLAGRFLGLAIDGWLGAAVSLLILWGGVRAARDAVSPLLGNPPRRDFVRRVEQIVRADGRVLGVHDLRVHDYGAGRVMISLHAEVPAEGGLMPLHEMIDGIERRLEAELGCEAVIHLDPVPADGGETEALRRRALEALRAEVDPRVTLHDFRVTRRDDRLLLAFDAVVPRDRRGSDEDLREEIARVVEALDPAFLADVTLDRPYTAKDR